MKDEKKTQEALLKTIDIMIENKLKNLGFNYYVDGVIKQVNSDGAYNVLINGTVYTNVPSKNNFKYLVNDTVQVLIKNGNWNKKFIDDKKIHDRLPQDILDIETDIGDINADIVDINEDITNIEQNYLNIGAGRIAIPSNSDLNDYLTVGCYKIESDTVASTISNLPFKSAGTVNVYSANGNWGVSDYIYLTQEYINLTGNVRYIRHICKSGSNAEWDYSRDWYMDVNAYTLANRTEIKSVLYDTLYPVGSIYVTPTNTNPSGVLGGTWKLFDCEFKSESTELTQGDEYTINETNTNTSNTEVVFTRSGHSIYFRIRINNKVTLGDGTYPMITVDFSKLGITRLPWTASAALGASDGGNGIVYANFDYSSGTLTIIDVNIKANMTKSEVNNTEVVTSINTTMEAGENIFFNITIPITFKYMIEDYCDKFYWKRTA